MNDMERFLNEFKEILLKAEILYGKYQDKLEDKKESLKSGTKTLQGYSNVLVFPTTVSHLENKQKQIEFEPKIQLNSQNKKYELIKFNDNPDISSNNQEEVTELKYRNITIKQHKTCSTWYARYRDNHGVQKYISAKTQKDCYNKLKKALKQLEKEYEKPNYTFVQWRDLWLKTYKLDNVRSSTLSSYKSMDNYLKPLENKYIIDIKIIDIINILNNIEFSRRKQQVYEYLKDIFTKAYENRIIQENIFINIKKPKHTSIKEKIALNSEEENIFIKICLKHKYGDYYLVCLFQGLRPGECMAIRRNDIHFENKTLTIDESINRGNNLTKNNYSKRTIPLFDRTIKILNKYKNYKDNIRIFDKSKTTYEDNLKEIVKEANIRDITTHELRHTFITRCDDLKINEKVLQQWVGHEIGSKVTKKTYTHINEEENIKYINIFNDNTKNL